MITLWRSSQNVLFPWKSSRVIMLLCALTMLQAHFCVSFFLQKSVRIPSPVDEHFIIRSLSPSITLSLPSMAKHFLLSHDVSQFNTNPIKLAWPHTWSLFAHLFLTNIQMYQAHWIDTINSLKNFYGNICSYCSVGNMRNNLFMPTISLFLQWLMLFSLLRTKKNAITIISSHSVLFLSGSMFC